VVGASTGIGKELTTELLRRGAIVIATSRNIEVLQKNFTSTNKEFSNQLLLKQADVSDSENINDLFKFIFDKSMELDYCFNCAGLCFFKNYTLVSDDEIKKIINVNLIGAINISRAAIEHYLHIQSKKKKYFIQIGSFAGAVPGHKRFSLYAATKEAQAGLLRSLQAEFGDQNIHFILVTPAGTDTEIYQNTLGDSNVLKEKLLSSILDSANNVAIGILENINNDLEDYGIRLFPTKLARETYQKFYDQK